MITIIHAKPSTFVLDLNQRLKRFAGVSDRKFNYHSGVTKPNYLVPVIPLDVEWWSDSIAVCEYINWTAVLYYDDGTQEKISIVRRKH